MDSPSRRVFLSSGKLPCPELEFDQVFNRFQKSVKRHQPGANKLTHVRQPYRLSSSYVETARLSGPRSFPCKCTLHASTARTLTSRCFRPEWRTVASATPGRRPPVSGIVQNSACQGDPRSNGNCVQPFELKGEITRISCDYCSTVPDEVQCLGARTSLITHSRARIVPDVCKNRNRPPPGRAPRCLSQRIVVDGMVIV